MTHWIHVADTDDVDEQDVMQVEVAGQVLAIYRLDDGFFATDGICSHAHACLADGFVMDDFIECPLHQGRFDIRTGKAMNPPASVDLRTYPLKIEGSAIFVCMD